MSKEDISGETNSNNLGNEPGSSGSKKGNKRSSSGNQVGPNLDSSLLAQSGQSPKDSRDRAGDLRAAQRGGKSSKSSGQAESATSAEETPAEPSLREAVQAQRRAQTKSRAKKALEKATAPARRATSKLLQEAWINIVPSWGLTIIWINIHVFLGMIFGNNFFCKLGAEWVDENIKKAQFDQAKDVGKVAGVFEGAGLACLDLGCLMLLLIVVAIVYFIISIISLNWDGINMIYQYLGTFVKLFLNI